MDDAVPTDRAARRAFADALWQLLLVALVILGTVLLARLGLGRSLARLFFMAGGLLLAAWTMSRSPWRYLTVTLWFWTLTPMTRRIVDHFSTFDPTNVILATPNLMAALMIWPVLASTSVLRLREAGIGLLVALPAGYGLAVNLISGQITSGLVGAADWLVPMLYYFYFVHMMERIDEAEPHISAFLGLNAPLLVAYGVWQFFSPPAWDAYWMTASGMPTIGRPAPYEVRSFSTLNAPYSLALWLCTVLLLALHFRTRLLLMTLPAAGILLLMTLVRAFVGCTVLGLTAAILLGGGRILRSLLVSGFVLVTVGSAALVSDPDLAERLVLRFTGTNSLEADTSAQDRLALYRAAPAMIDDNPLGLGIGALGRGAIGSTTKQDFVTVDGGPVAIYLALGWVAATIYCIGILVVIAQAVVAARRCGSVGVAVAAATVAAGGGLVFGNIQGFYGAVFWMCTGYAAALGAKARLAPTRDTPLNGNARLGRLQDAGAVSRASIAAGTTTAPPGRT